MPAQIVHDANAAFVAALRASETAINDATWTAMTGGRFGPVECDLDMAESRLRLALDMIRKAKDARGSATRKVAA